MVFEGLVAAVALGWVCQEPMAPEVGTGRAEAGYHWVVQADAACREPSLKQSEAPKGEEIVLRRDDSGAAPARETCGDREVRRTTLYFESGSAEISPLEASKLAPLMQQRILAIRVRGYTDPSGPSELNRRLSRKRAEAVWRIWKAMGGPMPIDRVTIQGLGECCPRNGDPSQDRRVELEVVIEPQSCGDREERG